MYRFELPTKFVAENQRCSVLAMTAEHFSTPLGALDDGHQSKSSTVHLACARVCQQRARFVRSPKATSSRQSFRATYSPVQRRPIALRVCHGAHGPPAVLK